MDLKKPELIPPENRNDFISYVCKVKKENIEKEYKIIKKIPCESSALEWINPYESNGVTQVMAFFLSGSTRSRY